MISDDELMERLVLKGGNALELVHRIGNRASLDIDFSIEGDFDDLADIRSRLEQSLTQRFATERLEVFDFSFTPKPRTQGSAEWGGYLVEFKLIDRTKSQLNIDDKRRQSTIVAPGQKRIFRIEISKNEFTQGKELATVDGYDFYVYTPAMIAIEKLRALCQQMPDYPLRKNPAPRPRDFYDICAIIDHTGLKLDDHRELVRAIFNAKRVPLRLLSAIASQRSFHQPAWPSVQQDVPASQMLRPFDEYVDRVTAAVEPLKPLWNE